MANTWICSICFVFQALTLKALVRHITLQHASQPNFSIKCGVQGCPEEYRKIDSFRKHLRRQHGDDLSKKTLHDPSGEAQQGDDYEQNDNPEASLSPPPDSSESEEAINEHCSNPINSSFDIAQVDQSLSLKRCASQFLVKLQAQSKISKVAVSNVISGTSILIEQVKKHLKQKVITSIKESSDESTSDAVKLVFDTFEDPFLELQTIHLQSSFVKKNMNYVPPRQYVLATKIVYKNKGAKRQIAEQDDTMVYIPILDSIQQLLSNPRISELITQQSKQCSEGIIYDVCDGEYYMNNAIFQEHPDALQVILYHDEVEVCNPLGSHTRKHKVDLYYYTLANLSPKFRSKLCAIRLFAVAKAQDVSKYGQNKILSPLFNDLQTLSNGHSFIINGQPKEMFGAVVSCLGDTEGQHQWGGFKIKVGWARQKCRCCLCEFTNMQENFRDDLFVRRSIGQYNDHCNAIESAPTPEARKDLQITYGLTERSLLSKLAEFDITTQLPQDIMHILLEGSVQYELRHILQHFISNNFITLKQLNGLFNRISLGYHDERNRPPPLRETVFNGQERYKLKQTAEQARIFLKHLPFCLEGFVQFDNSYFQLVLQIISIVSICFSPVISKETIQELKHIIDAHLTLFKELFPSTNITPKMHYMIHLPEQILQLGPMVRHCCLRFEARHQYFKDLAQRQNFKNICLSLAECCQHDDCADFETESPSQHPLFSTEREFGPTKKLSSEEAAIFLERIMQEGLFSNPEMFTKVFTAKWVRLYGTKYVANMCIIAVDANFVDKLPIFGNVKCIWLAEEEIIFEYTPYRTLQLNANLMAYEVVEFECHATKLCHITTMLDYNVYHIQSLINSLYIPLKYDLRDIIKQHLIGENPLHF